MANRVVQGVAALVVVLGLAGGVQSGEDKCKPGWVEELGCLNGVGGDVFATLSWNDGTGTSLYVGGNFDIAGCADRTHDIARWDGSRWSSLAGGLEDDFTSEVNTMIVFDDGTGPALFVAGEFQKADGTIVNSIAQWDGKTWSALEGPNGTGVYRNTAGDSWGEIYSMAVFDDGGGPALFVGGQFDRAGGVVVNNFARWDGSTWSAISVPGDEVGTDSITYALKVFDDGSGPALYVGGGLRFGSLFANRIAKWTGQEWSTLGDDVGVGVEDGGPLCMLVTDLGDGPSLVVAGSFRFAAGQPVDRIARWHNNEWKSIGDGTSGPIYALATYDDGDGSKLYAGGDFGAAGGQFVGNVARWDGASWSPLDTELITGTDEPVRTLVVHEVDGQAILFVGGEFSEAGGRDVDFLARWDGTEWLPSGSGEQFGFGEQVIDLIAVTAGGPTTIYAGGPFTDVRGEIANGVAEWRDGSWSPLVGPSGTGVNGFVRAASVASGQSDRVTFGGSFSSAGGMSANNIATWDGTEWQNFGQGNDGFNARVMDLCLFDDGSGEHLYAAGAFTEASGEPVSFIARWDGEDWKPVVSPNGHGLNGGVNALEVFDNGSGPSLYAGGAFTSAGGTTANNVARWDGESWHPLITEFGNGVSSTVNTLTAWQNGSLAGLYVGGRFEFAGDTEVNGIAKWDDAGWSSLSGPVGHGVLLPNGNPGIVDSIALFDDGSGLSIFASGRFISAGGEPAFSVARWRPSGWSALSAPMEAGFNGNVWTLASRQEGEVHELHVAGNFTSRGGTGAGRFSVWRGCSFDTCPPDVTGDGSIDLADLNLVLANFGKVTPDGDATGDGNVDLFDLNSVLGAFDTDCQPPNK